MTPNTLMWGQNAHPLEGEEDEDETSALNKRLKETKIMPGRDEDMNMSTACWRVTESIARQQRYQTSEK